MTPLFVKVVSHNKVGATWLFFLPDYCLHIYSVWGRGKRERVEVDGLRLEGCELNRHDPCTFHASFINHMTCPNIILHHCDVYIYI